jgi:ubiquinone/menaquinone biosynthesis C-methylase UbiE
MFYKIDLDKLPFPDEHFGLVFSITVLHHNNFEQQSKLINELVRVTAPNGYILLMEAISDKRDHLYFNTYTRPINDWVSEVTRDNRTKLIKSRLARWYLLKEISCSFYNLLLKVCPIVQLIQRRGKFEKINNKIQSLIIKMSWLFDPYIVRLLPRRYAKNATMLFKKY